MINPSCPVAGHIDPEGAARITAVLAQAFTAGVAFDPLDRRSPGLHSLGLSLDALAAALQAELAVRDASLADVGADPRGEHWLSRILAEMERLAALSRLDPGAETDGASAV